jgi:fibronectin type 3 domain-containing protein
VNAYRIYRGVTPGGESYLANASGLTYTDTAVSPGKTYYYYLTAVDQTGAASDPSMEVQAVIPPVGGQSNINVTGLPK